MKKTISVNPNNVEKNWYFIDAKDKVLGRVATEAAELLIGKHRVDYSPNQYLGDRVVILNARNVAFTGGKAKGKIYYRHSDYPGGLKSETLGSLMDRRPTEALRRAINGMLPKNKLRKKRMSNLHIYEDENHPHEAHEVAERKK